MAKNYKWGAKKDERALHIVLFVSRNKDNADVADFKQRRESFVTKDAFDSDVLKEKFNTFVKFGVKGEMCRMYYSVNARNEDYVRKALMKQFVDEPELNVCAIGSFCAKHAAKAEASATKRWMFDFDLDDAKAVKQFCEDIKDIDATVECTIRKTPNCYAVVVNHGFDTRKLMEKWKDVDVSVKKDDMLCVDWKTKK